MAVSSTLELTDTTSELYISCIPFVQTEYGATLMRQHWQHLEK
jgi:hypothetical protein